MGLFDKFDGEASTPDRTLAWKGVPVDTALISKMAITFRDLCDKPFSYKRIDAATKPFAPHPHDLAELCIVLVNDFLHETLNNKNPQGDGWGRLPSYFLEQLLGNAHAAGHNNFFLPLKNCPLYYFSASGTQDNPLYVTVEGNMAHAFGAASQHAVITLYGNALDHTGEVAANTKIQIFGTSGIKMLGHARDSEVIVHNKINHMDWGGDNCKVYVPRGCVPKSAPVYDFGVFCGAIPTEVYAIEDGLPSWAIQNGNT